MRSSLRSLWGYRWRNLPLTMLAATLAVACMVGFAAVAVIGGVSPSGNATSVAAAGEKAAAVRARTARDVARQRAAQATARKAATEKAGRAKVSRGTVDRGARQRAASKGARAKRQAPGWVLPMTGYELTGRFGSSGSNWSSSHHGLDFAAPTGTPIRAVGPGQIVVSGWGGAYGNHLEIRHPDGTVTLYGHMSRYARTSGTVKAGTVIGYVGATGNVTGPHLHLEVRPHGGGLESTIDPEKWLSDKGLRP